MVATSLRYVLLLTCVQFLTSASSPHHIFLRNAVQTSSVKSSSYGSSQSTKALSNKCYLLKLMPTATCSEGRCGISENIIGSDCTKCQLVQLMPRANCKKGSCPNRMPCNVCSFRTFMPLNDCAPYSPCYQDVTPAPTPKTTTPIATTKPSTTASPSTSAPNSITPAPSAPKPQPPANSPTTTKPNHAPVPNPSPASTTTKPAPTTAPKPSTGQNNNYNNNNPETTNGNNGGTSQPKPLGAGPIAGIAIGCGVAACAAGVLIWKKRKEKKREEQLFEDPQDMEQAGLSGDYAAM